MVYLTRILKKKISNKSLTFEQLIHLLTRYCYDGDDEPWTFFPRWTPLLVRPKPIPLRRRNSAGKRRRSRWPPPPRPSGPNRAVKWWNTVNIWPNKKYVSSNKMVSIGHKETCFVAGPNGHLLLYKVLVMLVHLVLLLLHWHSVHGYVVVLAVLAVVVLVLLRRVAHWWGTWERE